MELKSTITNKNSLESAISDLKWKKKRISEVEAGAIEITQSEELAIKINEKLQRTWDTSSMTTHRTVPGEKKARAEKFFKK